MKTTSIIAVGLIAWGGYTVATQEPNSEEIQAAHLKQCQTEHGAENVRKVNRYTSEAKCYFTEAYEELAEAKEAEEKALAKAKKEEEKRLAEEKLAEEKRIKEEKRLAFLASPEGKTKTFTSQAFTLCRQHVRASAKFPSKVDFDWGGNAKKYWMNFSEGKSRVMIQNSGEMMNGFGMMIPFKATCKYDYDPNTNKYSIVEILI